MLFKQDVQNSSGDVSAQVYVMCKIMLNIPMHRWTVYHVYKHRKKINLVYQVSEEASIFQKTWEDIAANFFQLV